MKSHLDSDCSPDLCGRTPDYVHKWHHRLRQSWLKTSTICLERARLEHAGDMPDDESDAANIGSAVHTAIETCLSDPLSLADTTEVFNMDFSERIEHHAFRWVKYTEKTARTFGERCVRQWHTVVLPGLTEPRVMEHEFCLPIVDDDRQLIELSGTIDYVGERTGMIDWKTSGGREWAKWEHERWDIQPTVYTWAAAQEGLIPWRDFYLFTFVVLGGKQPTHVPVVRRPGDFAWLKAKCIETAQLIELGLDQWPTNDTHALCSAKWCPAWSMCKGKYVESTWPR